MDEYNAPDKQEYEKRVIESYQSDERMMILIFAQWCINNTLDPKELYVHAYPEQAKNVALKDALALTVSKEESEDIPDHSVLNVLEIFGNNDLAFIVTEAIEKRDRP